MIRNVSQLEHLTIGAIDGDIGEVREVYFDDARWTIRYLIVDTGGWLSGRLVLISPFAVREWSKGRIDVSLPREQVKNSPDIDTQRPVSRQHERAFLDYYGYPYYWDGLGVWGAFGYPVVVPPPEARPREASEARSQGGSDPHLRSSREVNGYHIEATDGAIGHIEDFLFDEQTWTIRYIVVDTRKWLPGKHVLIAPHWIDRVSWEERRVYVHVTRGAVKESPEYDRDVPLARDYEANLHRHYGQDHRQDHRTR